MRKFLCVLVCLFTLVITLFTTGCAEVSFDEDCGELVVGLECEYAPFNWTETSASDTNVPIYGETGLYAEGYDIQIAKIIADRLNKKLVIKKIAWLGLIPALESGDIDLIIAGMSPTEERKESINFTTAYYNSNHVVVVKKDSNYSNATRFTDFADAKIIGQKNTSYDTLASELAEKGNGEYQVGLDTVPLIVASIISNVSDATILEKPVALSVCNNNPELAFVDLIDEFDVDETLLMVSIGVRKVDTSLLSRVDEVIQSITNEQRDSIMLKAVQSE